MATLKEFMSEQRSVTRWTIMSVGLIGAFAGATLAVIFMLAAFVG